MAIEIEVDVGALRQQFADLSDSQIPFITAFALTKTVQDVKTAEVAEMSEVFDRPTPWTLDSLQVNTASKADDPITGSVQFKEFAGTGTPAFKFLAAEIEGGPRHKKSHELALERAGIMRSDEYAVPGNGVALDAYGNMSGSLIEAILSDVQAAEGSAGYQANATPRSRRRGGAQSSYFMLRGRSAPDGIYWRSPGTRRIIPMIVFVRAPSYLERFAVYDKARATVALSFERNFAAVYASTLAGGKYQSK